MILLYNYTDLTRVVVVEVECTVRRVASKCSVCAQTRITTIKLHLRILVLLSHCSMCVVLLQSIVTQRIFSSCTILLMQRYETIEYQSKGPGITPKTDTYSS